MTMKQRVIAGSMALIMAASMAMPLAVSAHEGEGNNFSGYSIEQLEQLIARLQKLLEEMKKGAQCFVSDHDLSLGDGDSDELTADVRRLQDFLREKGFYHYRTSGYFGKATRASLMAFQTSVGVTASGDFDAATRAKVSGLTCKYINKGKLGFNGERDRSNDKNKDKSFNSDRKTSQVKSITLSVDGKTAHWTVDGTSPMGFKVVWSKNSGPTYPTRDGDKYNYLGDPSASSADLEAFSGSGAYYVRVCEYLGGACGTYSNEVTANL